MGRKDIAVEQVGPRRISGDVEELIQLGHLLGGPRNPQVADRRGTGPSHETHDSPRAPRKPIPSRTALHRSEKMQVFVRGLPGIDRKSTRLNSSHVKISYA